jgi:hypothetical protein
MAPISGGMEHQTMTTQGFFEKTLTAHELAHQWWGNQVTCASWSDIWVNEGWASYSEYLMLENLYPAEKNQHMLDVHNNVMSQPNGSVWCLDSLNEGRIFSGRLTYDKGAGIIHSMRNIVNDDNLFFEVLNSFQTKYKDSVATGIDFKNELELQTGIDFDPFFEQWYFGEGYPTYALKWNQVGNDLFVKISHITSASNVTPTFTNPLDVRFIRVGLGDTIIRFNINSNNELFVISEMGQITNSISIDPNNWVINQVASILQDNTLGSINLEEESKIEVYPNPTDGVFQILNLNQNAEIKIFNTNGQLLLSKNIAPNDSIDIQEFSMGTYILDISFKENKRRIKLLTIK